MRRTLYMAAEWALVYAFTLGVGLVFLWFAGVFGNWLALPLVLLWAVTSIPVSLKLVTFGPGRMSLAGGFYDPVRPLATAGRAGLFGGAGANRTELHIPYVDRLGRDPFDVVRLLSAELEAQGIAHSYAGHISVTDGAARWRVQPSLDGDVIEGWVDADDPDDRRQIVEGLEDFLRGRLSLAIGSAR